MGMAWQLSSYHQVRASASTAGVVKGRELRLRCAACRSSCGMSISVNLCQSHQICWELHVSTFCSSRLAIPKHPIEVTWRGHETRVDKLSRNLQRLMSSITLHWMRTYWNYIFTKTLQYPLKTHHECKNLRVFYSFPKKMCVYFCTSHLPSGHPGCMRPENWQFVQVELIPVGIAAQYSDKTCEFQLFQTIDGYNIEAKATPMTKPDIKLWKMCPLSSIAQ